MFSTVHWTCCSIWSREQQFDIATVSLAARREQYFDYIALMDSLDIELAAEYLVMAATLVFLKSKSLLPPVPLEFEVPEETAPSGRGAVACPPHRVLQVQSGRR